jgi:hypothetical protein
MESTVGGPLPYSFDGVIVNVYAAVFNSVYKNDVPLVVSVVGSENSFDDTIVYKVAPGDAFHTRSMVSIVELLITKPVTAGGICPYVLENTATPLVMKLITTP